MSKLTAKETVTLLKEIFSRAFGGKENGRYKISIEQLLRLSGNKIYSFSFVNGLQEEAAEQGVALINTGNSFSVIEMAILTGYRNVPPHVVETLLKNSLKNLTYPKITG